MDKKEILEKYIREIKKRNKHRKKSECYCSATEDALHLLNHKKCLCRTCYSYKDKKDMTKLSPLCKMCTKRMFTLAKRFKITKDKAQELIRLCFEYKIDDRIERLRKGIEQSKEECPYDMMSGKIINIRNEGIIADYSNIKVDWSFQELEVLKRIKQKRLTKEYEEIRNKGRNSYLKAKGDLFTNLRSC